MLLRKRKRLFVKFDLKRTFSQKIISHNSSSFHNFVQKVDIVNGIWCLRRLIIALRLLVENGGMSNGWREAIHENQFVPECVLFENCHK